MVSARAPHRHDVAIHEIVARHVRLGRAHHRSLAQAVVEHEGSGDERMELGFTANTPDLVNEGEESAGRGRCAVGDDRNVHGGVSGGERIEVAGTAAPRGTYHSSCHLQPIREIATGTARSGRPTRSSYINHIIMATVAGIHTTGMNYHTSLVVFCACNVQLELTCDRQFPS